VREDGALLAAILLLKLVQRQHCIVGDTTLDLGGKVRGVGEEGRGGEGGLD
jgi:hypothetical protein